jgi:hypothetical protein
MVVLPHGSYRIQARVLDDIDKEILFFSMFFKLDD